MMKPFVWIIILLFTIHQKSVAQSAVTHSSYIIYDLPQSVNKKVKEHIEQYRAKGDRSPFIAQLSRNGDNTFALFVIKNDTTQLNATSRLLQEGLIKKTNRMINIDDDMLLPLLFNEDFIFATLEKEKLPNGKVARKKVRLDHDSYVIRFDLYGKILEK